MGDLNFKGVYKCEKCGFTVKENCWITCPECGGILAFKIDISAGHTFYTKTILKAEKFWDYHPLFPVAHSSAISLGEGNTPLVRLDRLGAKLGVKSLMVKNEGQNPSGSFKDRCMSLSYTRAVEIGAPATVLASAGNAGASAAMYAARAGIPCFLFVPGTIQDARIAQSLMNGARVIKVEDGGVTECIELIASIVGDFDWFNVTTAAACNPYQAESEKTIAYEIAKSMNYESPDYVVVPVGGGGCLSGIFQGFKDLVDLGLVNKLPRIVAVQDEGCCPLVKAFNDDVDPWDIVKEETVDGVALSILDAYPMDGPLALRAIYESGGIAVAVSAHEIMKAQSTLARTEGLLAEVASSTTIAALGKLAAKGIVAEEDCVVCVLTGFGYKDLNSLKPDVSPLTVPFDSNTAKLKIQEYFS
ncbi:MAG TPA: threonine synthase [Clostridiaceae bacterium]|nr:threonine synthase [Clostridiaceae bacterium]